MLEEYKTVEKEGKQIIIINQKAVLKILEEIRKSDSSISNSKLFDLLPASLVLGLLINARYKVEQNIELTDVQNSLRNECGDLGRMYVADLYTRMYDTIKQPLEEPFKAMGDLTIEEIEKDFKTVLGDLPVIKKEN